MLARCYVIEWRYVTYCGMAAVETLDSFSWTVFHWLRNSFTVTGALFTYPSLSQRAPAAQRMLWRPLAYVKFVEASSNVMAHAQKPDFVFGETDESI